MAAIHGWIAQVADERLCERLAAGWARARQPGRRRRAAGGAEPFVRLEINAQAAVQQVLLIGTAAQPDNLFEGVC